MVTMSLPTLQRENSTVSGTRRRAIKHPAKLLPQEYPMQDLDLSVAEDLEAEIGVSSNEYDFVCSFFIYKIHYS
jgi:hypothetical protein